MSVRNGLLAALALHLLVCVSTPAFSAPARCKPVTADPSLKSFAQILQFAETQGFVPSNVCSEDAEVCEKLPGLVDCVDGASRSEGRCNIAFIRPSDGGVLIVTYGMIIDTIEEAKSRVKLITTLSTPGYQPLKISFICPKR